MGKKKSPKKPSPRKYLSKKSTTKKYPSMKESAPASTSTSKHMPSSADSGVIPALEDLEISLPTDSTAPTDLNPPMDSIPETDSSAEKITILSGDLDSAATDTGSDLPIAPVKVVSTTSPRPIEKTKVIEAQNLFTDTKPQSSTHKTSEDTYLLNQEKKKPDDSWCDIAKGSAKKLQKKGKGVDDGPRD